MAGSTQSSDGSSFVESPAGCGASADPATGSTRLATPVVFFDGFFIACLLLSSLSGQLAGPSFLEPTRSADQWSASR
ncbi:hypothetical protein BE15_30315 [Sorangium cellulosum]|uniref:Uncharacterized protein n=1 Tax=Sorangium cellulosum TaxID=56 RepID=A0A150QS12_SORCE|nr:hypothetical protein BE15_30315 [Sorangium cellulosum]